MRLRGPRILTILILSAAAIGATAVPALATAPKITSFTPISGQVGAPVTILGKTFTGATDVSFNGTSASFTFVNATEITTTVPSGATTGPISVTTPGGVAISANNFSVSPPTAAINLNKFNGPPGTTLTVSGGGFASQETVDVYFDTTDMTLVTTTVAGAFNNVQITVPASAVPGTHWITANGRRSGIGAQVAFGVRTDWAQFRDGPKHRGVNTTENVLSPSTVGGIDLDWSFITGSEIVYSSPSVVSGIAYIGSTDGDVYAVNASTGSLVWSYTTGNSIYSSPAVANGVVYVSSTDAKVYALNASTGALIWSYGTTGATESSPAVANGIVYVGSTDDKVYALNASTGALVWSYKTGATVFSSPAVANGVVYVGSMDDYVYALNASTGALVWSYKTQSGISYSSPTVADGVVYVGSTDDKVYALNASFGGLVWSYTTGNPIYSSPAVANGVVYVGSTDDKVYALNAVAGTVVWSYATGDSIYSSPAVANGVVYLGSYDGKAYALSCSTGGLLWRYSTGNTIESSPAVANGVVYLGSDDDKLYAFDLAGGSASVVQRPNPTDLKPNMKLKPTLG